MVSLKSKITQRCQKLISKLTVDDHFDHDLLIFSLVEEGEVVLLGARVRFRLLVEV